MDLLKKFLIGTLVIAFPLGEVARISFNEIAVTLLDIAVAVTFLLWFIQKKRKSQAKLSKPIFIFIGTLLLSLLVNLNRLTSFESMASFLYLLRFIFYAGLYFIVLDLLQFKKVLIKSMLIGGGILILGGYIQYFLYSDLRNLYYLGWDEHLYRMFSSFLDPNFAGAFFVLYFLFLINKLFGTKNQTESLVLKLIIIATFVAVILTFSRSAYITLVLGLIVFLFLKGKRLLVGGTLLLFVLLTLLFSQITLKSEGTNLLRIASTEARIDSLKNAVTIFKDNPIFGIGFNSYRYAQRDYGFVDESKMTVHSAAGTDNSFLFVLATSGIIGFSAFMYLWFKILSTKDPLLISSSIALFANSIFVNSLFYPFIMLWMWALIGLKESK